jgi:glycosyltransferase involved in cell wall biosynthesis
MKIFQVIQKSQLRGAEIFACQLAEHLKNRGHEVTVICLFEGHASLPFSGEFIFLNRQLNSRLVDLQGWKVFARLVKKEQPDIIQANASDTLKFTAMSKFCFGWKNKLVFRNASKMGDFLKSKAHVWLNQFFVKQTNGVASVSALCQDDFIGTFHFPRAKTACLTIGVEPQPIPKAIPADLIPIFENHQVIVTVGSLVSEKNPIGVLEIFHQFQQSHPNAFLLMVGDGKLRPEMEAKIKSLQLEDRVLLSGFRKDVLSILSHAQVMLMPSYIEGLPGVILEAMYCQLPVIASNVGGISEVVTEETGWLIESPNDQEAFISALERVFTNQEEVRVRVKNAKEMVQSRFLNQGIAAKFEEFYQRVLTF